MNYNECYAEVIDDEEIDIYTLDEQWVETWEGTLAPWQVSLLSGLVDRAPQS